MFKSILTLLVLCSLTLSANEIFTKEAEQFKAIASYKDSKVNIKITPKGKWHINTGFPISVKPSKTCLAFGKEKYKKADAKVFKETELSFEIPASCKEGEKALKANVVLGVCTESICNRVQFNIDAKINSEKKVEEKKAEIKKAEDKVITDIKKEEAKKAKEVKKVIKK